MVIAKAWKWNVPRLSHLSGICLVRNVVISLWMCGDAPSCCTRMRIVNSNVDQTLSQRSWHEVDYHLDVSSITNGTQIIWNMILEKFHLGLYNGVLLILSAYSFFYEKFSSPFAPFAVTLYYLNIRPQSSETEGIMRTAYFQSGARYLLLNNFRLHQ